MHRRIDEFGFSGSERRRQPERLQTCYENHNALRIKCAYNSLVCSSNILLIEIRFGEQIILLLIVLVTNCYELSPLRIVAVTNCRRYELSPFANVTNCRPLRIVACYELSLCLLIILISKKGHESNCQINLSLDYHICTQDEQKSDTISIKVTMLTPYRKHQK